MENNMKSCTIIVSHYESLSFLKACIRQIRKYKNPKIEQHIIICDQSSQYTFDLILLEYGNNDDVRIVQTKPLYSGYGLDSILRYFIIKSDYIAQIHVDAFPIHKNWLSMPIALIEKSKLAFVGQLQCV